MSNRALSAMLIATIGATAVYPTRGTSASPASTPIGDLRLGRRPRPNRLLQRRSIRHRCATGRAAGDLGKGTGDRQAEQHRVDGDRCLGGPAAHPDLVRAGRVRDSRRLGHQDVGRRPRSGATRARRLRQPHSSGLRRPRRAAGQCRNRTVVHRTRSGPAKPDGMCEHDDHHRLGRVRGRAEGQRRLKIDLKVIKISLASREVAAKRETSYSIEFNFGTPRTNRCGFLRPAAR